MPKDSVFQIRIESGFKRRAQRVAAGSGHSLAELIIDLLEDYCEGFDACDSCGRQRPLDDLEGAGRGDYTCKACLELEVIDAV